MNFHEVFTAVIDRLAPHRLSILIAAVGLILLVSGLISLLGSNQNSQELIFEGVSAENATDSAELDNRTILVDVEGAVVKPGVYKLPINARIQDALIAAMGLSSNADRDWIAKHINLASKLIDGAKVYVPEIGENITPQRPGFAGQAGISGSTAGTGIGETSQININAASVSELDSLSGVGPVTAQKIIDNRPYSDIQELITKKVVGQSVFEKIKEKITTY